MLNADTARALTLDHAWLVLLFFCAGIVIDRVYRHVNLLDAVGGDAGDHLVRSFRGRSLTHLSDRLASHGMRTAKRDGSRTKVCSLMEPVQIVSGHLITSRQARANLRCRRRIVRVRLSRQSLLRRSNILRLSLCIFAAESQITIHDLRLI